MKRWGWALDWHRWTVGIEVDRYRGDWFVWLYLPCVQFDWRTVRGGAT
jgi:hypothetical protein